MLLILSPASANSRNVRNEISFALEEGKVIIPILYQDCTVPLQLRRIQHVDLRVDYDQGLIDLLKHLGVPHRDQSRPATVESVKAIHPAAASRGQDRQRSQPERVDEGRKEPTYSLPLTEDAENARLGTGNHDGLKPVSPLQQKKRPSLASLIVSCLCFLLWLVGLALLHVAGIFIHLFLIVAVFFLILYFRSR